MECAHQRGQEVAVHRLFLLDVEVRRGVQPLVIDLWRQDFQRAAGGGHGEEDRHPDCTKHAVAGLAEHRHGDPREAEGGEGPLGELHETSRRGRAAHESLGGGRAALLRRQCQHGLAIAVAGEGAGGAGDELLVPRQRFDESFQRLLGAGTERLAHPAQVARQVPNGHQRGQADAGELQRRRLPVRLILLVVPAADEPPREDQRPERDSPHDSERRALRAHLRHGLLPAGALFAENQVSAKVQQPSG